MKRNLRSGAYKFITLGPCPTSSSSRVGRALRSRAAVHAVARTVDHREYQWTSIPAVAETREAAEACCGGQTQSGAGRVHRPARARTVA